MLVRRDRGRTITEKECASNSHLSKGCYILRRRAIEMKVTKYIRYSAAGKTSYGMVEGENIRELHGSIFTGAEPTGRIFDLSEVKILAPCEPSKVIAVGRNYKSHI